MNDVIILASSNVFLTDFTEPISSSIKSMQCAAQGDQNKCFSSLSTIDQLLWNLPHCLLQPARYFLHQLHQQLYLLERIYISSLRDISSIYRSMVDHAFITINYEINNRLSISGTSAITHDRATILRPFCSQNRKPIVNFIIYCDRSMIYHTSIDTTNISKTADIYSR